MADTKIIKKKGSLEGAKRFDKILNQPVSKRIADFLTEEGKKEKAKENSKIARSVTKNDFIVFAINKLKSKDKFVVTPNFGHITTR
jgi:hypothetical protein